MRKRNLVIVEGSRAEFLILTAYSALGEIMENDLGLSVIPAELLRTYKENLSAEHSFVFKSRQMRNVFHQISELTFNHEPVSIIGSFGSGRTIVARALHLQSQSWWRPFVVVDLNEYNLEEAFKKLYGFKEEHLFMSAEIKNGLIEQANESTICFKNFDLYHKDLQQELFNVYATGKFRPFGLDESQHIKCRFIFTLNKMPQELFKRGVLMDEIHNMLSLHMLEIPSLSKRREDILPLTESFILKCCLEFKMPNKVLTKETEKWLKKAPWNYNVYQLKKSVYFACINTDDKHLKPEHFALAHDYNIEGYMEKQLEELSLQSIIEMKLESFLSRLGRFEATHLYEAIMSRVEEPLLKLVMKYARGNQLKASSILGINRNTLRTKLRKYKIKVK